MYEILVTYTIPSNNESGNYPWLWLIRYNIGYLLSTLVQYLSSSEGILRLELVYIYLRSIKINKMCILMIPKSSSKVNNDLAGVVRENWIFKLFSA